MKSELVGLCWGLGICIMGATAASANCSPPSGVGKDDTIIQFANQDAVGSKGAMGTRGTLNATLPGTIYYDYRNKALRLCDGEEWVKLESLPGGEGTFPMYGTWKKTVSHDGEHPNSGATINIPTPIESIGAYTVKFYLYANAKNTAETCRLFVKDGGSRTSVFAVSSYREDGEGHPRSVSSTFKFYGRGNGTYAYEILDTESPQKTSTGLGRNTSNDNIGVVDWDGSMILIGEDGAYCKTSISMLRTG
jgi:hypothetical protein